MSNAFKCDACGEFSEGEPGRYKLKEYKGVGLTGWTGSTTVAKSELCEDCEDALVEAMKEHLGLRPFGEAEE